MHPRLTVIAALLVVGLAHGAGAQTAFSRAATAASSQPDDRTPVQLDVSRLPINLDRVHKQLRQTTVREERDGLHLRYTIDVYGRAPQIELFTPLDNLRTGPVPYGGPTHSEMLQQMTPQEFRAPVADVARTCISEGTTVRRDWRTGFPRRAGPPYVPWAGPRVRMYTHSSNENYGRA
jgi:hypothetical protein